MTQIDTGTDQLLCEVRDGVALITLNRPDARNALSDTLTPALRRMIKERGEDWRNFSTDCRWPSNRPPPTSP